MVAGILTWVTGAALAEIPNESEPDYSEAVIFYNTKRYDRALALLEQLQRILPKSAEVLELKALTLRATQKDKLAANVYKDLIDLKSKQGAPRKEIAPYAFELGMIRFNEKDYKKALGLFEYSLKEEFNPELSQFYVGMSWFQLKDHVKAKPAFEAVAQSNLAELRPAAHFYLAQCYFKEERSSRGIDQLIEADRTSTALIEDTSMPEESKQMARQISEAVSGVLKPLDKPSFFANLSLLAGYDSNVLLIPNESTSDTTNSGKSTFKGSLAGGLGYATSPMKRWQWVPNLRISGNKNSNSQSKTGEFMEGAVGLIANHNPLSHFSWGFKTEASRLYQMRTDTAGSSKYEVFSNSIGGGAFVRRELSERWSLSGDLFGRSLKYDGEESIADSLKRSGMAYTVRVILADLKRSKYWNPFYTAKFDLANTKGTEFSNKAYGAILGNQFQYKSYTFGQSLDVTRTAYSESSTNRSDMSYTLSLSANKKLTQNLSLIALGDLAMNRSSQASTYSYDRWTFSVGATLGL